MPGKCFISSVPLGQPPGSSQKHGSVLKRHIKILLSQMMKFLKFLCLAVHQRIYSFPSGECCLTHAPSSLGMLLYSSQMWGPQALCLGPQWEPAGGWYGPSCTRNRCLQTGRKLSQTAPKYRHTKATVHHPCISERTSARRTRITWTSLLSCSVQQDKRSTGIPLSGTFFFGLGVSQSQ